MAVKNYVNTNFTEVEISFFNYLLQTFPEHISVKDDGTDRNDILLLLALLAKTLGNSKELILNLKKSHSLEELYDDINEGSLSYLKDNNVKLLVPFAEDLSYPILNGKPVEDKIDIVQLEEPFIKAISNIIKYRGTRTYIKLLIDAFEKYVGKRINNTITIAGNQVNIYLEDLVDYLVPNVLSSDGDIDYYAMDTDNTFYKLLMYYKPAGSVYNVFISILSTVMQNLNLDFIIDTGKVQTIQNLDLISYETTQAQVVVPLESIEVSGSATNYKITLGNPSLLAARRLEISHVNSAEYALLDESGGQVLFSDEAIPYSSYSINRESNEEIFEAYRFVPDDTDYIAFYFTDSENHNVKSPTQFVSLSGLVPEPIVVANPYTQPSIDYLIPYSSDGYARTNIINTNNFGVIATIVVTWKSKADAIVSQFTETISLAAGATLNKRYYNPSGSFERKIDISIKFTFNNADSSTVNSGQYLIGPDPAKALPSGVNPPSELASN